MTSEKFWETMNLLIGKEYLRNGKDVMEDVQDWVDKVIVKKEISFEASHSDLVQKTGRVLVATLTVDNTDNKDQEIEDFIAKIEIPKVECKFSHPHVTSRLEKLMGSNLVSLTDRDYMQKLQERILEDYGESMEKRIKVRENEEMERVKNLVLSGRISLDKAPQSMADHPIMMIDKYCRKLIAARRKKIKIPKVHIPRHLYSDDTPDPPSGLSIENGHVFRKGTERLCNPVSRFLPTAESVKDPEIENAEDTGETEGEENKEDDEDVWDDSMFTYEEYNKLKYESPLIKMLKKCKTVEEMYTLADEIIGVLKTIEDTLPKIADKSAK